jgi:hypothetical protein
MRIAMLAAATMTITALVGGTAAADVQDDRGACFTRPGCTEGLIGYYSYARQCWRDGGKSWVSRDDGDCYDRFPR